MGELLDFEVVLRSMQPESRPRELDRWRTALTLALLAGDLETAERAAIGACGLLSAASVLDDLFAPAMTDIGLLWERGQITPADEHTATAALQRLLAAIAPAFTRKRARTTYTILLATPAPERHTHGLLMANDVLRGAGHRTILLGSGVPDEALAAALRRHRPDVVALSATMPDKDALDASTETIIKVLPRAHLLLGGGAAKATLPGLHVTRVHRVDAVFDAVEGLGPDDFRREQRPVSHG